MNAVRSVNARGTYHSSIGRVPPVEPPSLVNFPGRSSNLLYKSTHLFFFLSSSVSFPLFLPAYDTHNKIPSLTLISQAAFAIIILSWSFTLLLCRRRVKICRLPRITYLSLM